MRVVTDTFALDPPPTVTDVDYGELPLRALLAAVRAGDRDAAAWLTTHPDLTASGGLGAPPTAVFEFDPNEARDDKGRWTKDGADEGIIGIGQLRPKADGGIGIDPQSAAANWAFYSTAIEARFAAERMLGQDHPTVSKNMLEYGAHPRVLRALDQGTLPSLIDYRSPPRNEGIQALRDKELAQEDQRTQDAVDIAYTLMKGARDADPQTLPLYRGIAMYEGDPGIEALQHLKTGDQFDVSLASFSNDRQFAKSFAEMGGGVRDHYEGGVMLQVEPGARGLPAKGSESEVQAPSGAWVRGHMDVIVSGRFEVIDRISTGIDTVRVRQIGVFDPDHGGRLVKT